MIGTTSLEYLFIRTCILGLHNVAPLCVLYTILVICLYGTEAAFSRFPLIIECIALAETLFYFFVYLPYSSYLQREAIHPPPPSRDERKELFELCNKNLGDPVQYMRKWFLGAPMEEIKRENLKEFYLWAFFNRGGPPGDDDEELEEYLQITERAIGREIQPGRGNAVCLRLTIDKVDMMHRSLVWYSAVGFVDLLTYTRLIYHGFHFHRTSLSSLLKLFPFRFQALTTSYISPVKHTSYWHRPHTSKTRLPVIFIHGIGIGLYPYTNFLTELNSVEGLESSDPNDQVGIIAIEIMPVSFRICHAPLRKDALCAEINAILAHHGWEKFVLISHSYGTVISTHLLKSTLTSHKIAATVLIDPVSILLHRPDVAYNFTRRKPTQANEWQLYYFASMDMSVSSTLSRHFFWSENVLWKHDFEGRNVTVSLASNDLIVDTLACGRYLMSQSTASSLDKSQLKLDAEEKAIKDAQASLETPASSEGSDGDWLDEQGRKLSEFQKWSLRGKDTYSDVDTWKKRKWTGKGVDVLWFNGLDHAQVFDKKETRGPLIEAIKTYSRGG